MTRGATVPTTAAGVQRHCRRRGAVGSYGGHSNTCTALLNGCCKSNDPTEARRLFDVMPRLGLAPAPSEVTYTALFHVCFVFHGTGGGAGQSVRARVSCWTKCLLRVVLGSVFSCKMKDAVHLKDARKRNLLSMDLKG